MVLLTAPTPLILTRIATRTNNPYGKSAAEREAILRDLVAIEPLLRPGATLELVTTIPADEVADRIEHLGMA